LELSEEKLFVLGVIIVLTVLAIVCWYFKVSDFRQQVFLGVIIAIFVYGLLFLWPYAKTMEGHLEREFNNAIISIAPFI